MCVPPAPQARWERPMEQPHPDHSEYGLPLQYQRQVYSGRAGPCWMVITKTRKRRNEIDHPRRCSSLYRVIMIESTSFSDLVAPEQMRR